MRLLSCTALLLVALVCTGAAQPAVPKSTSRAFNYSLTGTVVPAAIGTLVMLLEPKPEPLTPDLLTWSQPPRWYEPLGLALIGAGVAIGPSLGHLYAGRPGMLLPRSIGVAFIWWGTSLDMDSGGVPVVTVASAFALVTTVWDFVKIPGAVRSYNSRFSTISPVVAPGGGPDGGVLVGVRWTL